MKYSILILIMFSLANLCSQDMPPLSDITYRPPTVAGSFYPSDKAELSKWIDDYLDDSPVIDEEGEILAIVSPHAGYQFSGWVAARAWRQVQGGDYDVVIIIGPSHQEAFSGSSVYNGTAYVTPLGEALVDKELASAIADGHSSVELSINGHRWQTERTEHSIEVQVPFVQKVLPKAKIVPICMGGQDAGTCDALMRAITSALKNTGRKTLIVASTDLSHFHTDSQARELDRQVVDAFNIFDYFKMGFNFSGRRWEACGGGPVIVAMTVAEQQGATKAKALEYATSYDSPYIKTDTSRVVGYFSGIVYKDLDIDPDDLSYLLPTLTDSQKEYLLDLAAKAIKASTTGKEIKKSARDLETEKDLMMEYGLFVTIKKHEQLRGCIGYIYSIAALPQSTEHCGRQAAQNDTRFQPVSENEISELEHEITILSRFKRILNPEDVVPGRDGVYLRVGRYSGVFLPQVATEQGWDRKIFLEQLGRKAGLDIGAYKLPDAQLYIFQAMILE